jgi:hypothetical protein
MIPQLESFLFHDITVVIAVTAIMLIMLMNKLYIMLPV